MLSGVNVIYLEMEVLIMLVHVTFLDADGSVVVDAGRVDGRPSDSAGRQVSRYTIVPLHNANATLSKMLTELWAGKSAQEAHDILAAPDVQVTNESDKER